jgi:hypothetical protein
MTLIQRWKYSEPTLRIFLLRILIPYATLLDALIGILSFTFLHSSFQLWIVEKHMDFYFQYKIKQQEKNK